MKNTIKLIGIIAFVVVVGLLLAGCGKKGGTVEFKNSTGQEVTVFVGFGDDTAKATADLATKMTGDGTKVPNGETKEVGSTNEDGNYAASWVGSGTGGTGTKAGTISGGDKVSLP